MRRMMARSAAAKPAGAENRRCRGLSRAPSPVSRGADRESGSDHRFALSMPALPSAPSKKSFSSVNSPIFAWSAFKSTVGPMGAGLGLGPKYSGSPLQKLCFPLRDLVDVHVGIVAPTRPASSPPFRAANATFASNAGLWFRRTRFVIVSPDPQPPWPLSGKNST